MKRKKGMGRAAKAAVIAGTGLGLTTAGILLYKRIYKPPPPEPVRVSISGDAFIPSVVNVKFGQSVIWRNDDPHPHTVTSILPNEVYALAGSLNPGQEFTYFFAPQPEGSPPVIFISYTCLLHPEMFGAVAISHTGLPPPP